MTQKQEGRVINLKKISLDAFNEAHYYKFVAYGIYAAMVNEIHNSNLQLVISYVPDQIDNSVWLKDVRPNCKIQGTSYDEVCIPFDLTDLSAAEFLTFKMRREIEKSGNN